VSLRVLVVDDEPLARLGVTARLSAHPDMTVVGECGSGDDAVAEIRRLNPDLVFLDIQMPGISGLEVLERLPKDKEPIVIFLTAHEEYAIDAFGVQALDYLLKPIDDARFQTSLSRARRLHVVRQHESIYDRLEKIMQQGPPTECAKRFPVRRGTDIIFVDVDDVEWIEGLGDYAGLHVGAKTHLIRESLTSLDTRLSKTDFLRIHRSTIVRVDHILRVEPLANRDYLLTLKNQTTVRSSRTYSRAVKNLIRNEH
jgi:two-component system LytT family response regulator